MKSKLGYKRNSPDKNRPFNIIPSGRITMKEDNGTPLKKGPILGIDNLGNYEMMYPGMEYQFPGNEVFEIPMAQLGAENRKESGQKDLSYKWSEPMSKRSLPISYTKVQKGGWLDNLPKAQIGLETKPTREELIELSNQAEKVYNFYKNSPGYTQEDFVVSKFNNEPFTKEDLDFWYTRIYDPSIYLHDNNNPFTPDFLRTNNEQGFFGISLQEAQKRINELKNSQFLSELSVSKDWLQDLENANKKFYKDQEWAPQVWTTSDPNYQIKDTDKIYRKDVNDNVFFQRELQHGTLNAEAPMQMFYKNIKPQKKVTFRNKDTNDHASIYYYDPIAVKPYDMLTEEEQQKRLELYGTEGTPLESIKNFLTYKITELPEGEQKGNQKYVANVVPETYLSGEQHPFSKRLILSQEEYDKLKKIDTFKDRQGRDVPVKFIKQKGGSLKKAQAGLLKTTNPYSIENLEPTLQKFFIDDADLLLAEQKGFESGMKMEGLRSGPLDAVRHAAAAASMSSKVPSWANLVPPIALGNIAFTNIAGLAHELESDNSLREIGSDLYNNFIGSLIGTLPLSKEKRADLIIKAQQNNILSTINKQDGGKLKKAQRGTSNDSLALRNLSEQYANYMLGRDALGHPEPFKDSEIAWSDDMTRNQNTEDRINNMALLANAASSMDNAQARQMLNRMLDISRRTGIYPAGSYPYPAFLPAYPQPKGPFEIRIKDKPLKIKSEGLKPIPSYRPVSNFNPVMAKQTGMPVYNVQRLPEDQRRGNQQYEAIFDQTSPQPRQGNLMKRLILSQEQYDQLEDYDMATPITGSREPVKVQIIKKRKEGGRLKKAQVGTEQKDIYTTYNELGYPIYTGPQDFYEKNKNLTTFINKDDETLNIPNTLRDQYTQNIESGKPVNLLVDPQAGDKNWYSEDQPDIDYVCTAEGCTARANRAVGSLYYGSGKSFYQNPDKSKTDMGAAFSTATRPTPEQVAQYNYMYGDTDSGSLDAWDIVPNAMVNAPKNVIYQNIYKHDGAMDQNVFAAKRAEVMKNQVAAKDIWKKYKIPVGAYINVGSTPSSYRDDVVAGSHTVRVVGYTPTGEPLIADYGQIKPLSQNYYGPDAYVAGIVSVPGKEKYNYDFFLKNAMDVRTPEDPNKNPYLKNITDPANVQRNFIIDSDRKYGKDYKTYHDALVTEKDFIKAKLGLDSDQYDKYAKLALTIGGLETEFGKGNLYNILDVGESKGVSQLMKKNIEKDYKETLAKYPKGTPQHDAVATMLYIKELDQYKDKWFKQGEKGQERPFVRNEVPGGIEGAKKAGKDVIRSIMGEKPTGYFESHVSAMPDYFADEKGKINLPYKQIWQSDEDYTKEVNEALKEAGRNDLRFAFKKNDKGELERTIYRKTQGNKIPKTLEDAVLYAWQSPSALVYGDAEGRSNYYQKGKKLYKELFGENKKQLGGTNITAKWLDKLQEGKEVKTEEPVIMGPQNIDDDNTLYGTVNLPNIDIVADKNTGDIYPYYNTLSQEEKNLFRDRSPIGRSLRAKATTGRTPTAQDIVSATTGIVTGPAGIAGEVLQTPQSAMVEGIEALRGKPYSFQNALPFSGKQRVPSETFGITNPYLGFAADMFMDPEMLIPGAFAKNLMENVTKQGLKQGLKTTGQNIVSTIPNLASETTSRVQNFNTGINNLNSGLKELKNKISLLRNKPSQTEISKNELLQYNPNLKGPFKFEIVQFHNLKTYDDLISKYGLTPSAAKKVVEEPVISRDEIMRLQQEQADVAKDFYDSWVTKDPVRYNTVINEIEKTRDDLYFLSNIASDPYTTPDELINVNKQIKDAESKLINLENESLELIQDDVRKKIENVTSDALTNSIGVNPDLVGKKLPEKDRLRLIYPFDENEAYKSLLKRDQDYVQKNAGRVGGFRSSDATVTFGYQPTEYNYLKYGTSFNPWNIASWFKPITTKGDPYSAGRYFHTTPSDWIDPLEVGRVTGHELGHDLQKMLSRSGLQNWGDFIAEDNPTYKYYTSTGVNNPVAKRFANALVEPKLPITKEKHDPQTWLSSGNELHADIMGERFLIYNDLINKGYSKKQAISFMKANDDAIINEILDKDQIKRFFKTSTPRQERFDLIKKYMPAVAGFGTFGYLGSQGLNQNNEVEYQNGGQKKLKKMQIAGQNTKYVGVPLDTEEAPYVSVEPEYIKYPQNNKKANVSNSQTTVNKLLNTNYKSLPNKGYSTVLTNRNIVSREGSGPFLSSTIHSEGDAAAKQGKFFADILGTVHYPTSLMASVLDAQQGQYKDAALGAIPVIGRQASNLRNFTKGANIYDFGRDIQDFFGTNKKQDDNDVWAPKYKKGGWLDNLNN